MYARNMDWIEWIDWLVSAGLGFEYNNDWIDSTPNDEISQIFRR